MQTKRYDPEIWTASGILSAEECREIITRAEHLGFSTAVVRTQQGPRMLPGVRNNDRAALDDPELARVLWERVREHVPAEIDGCPAVGLLDHFRFYRYDPGQQFKRHRDGSEPGPNGSRSRLTCLIYLNDGFEGGETIFSDFAHAGDPGSGRETRIAPEAGAGLFFVHERRHEGSAPRAGRKYVLRTDVLYAAPGPPPE